MYCATPRGFSPWWHSISTGRLLHGFLDLVHEASVYLEDKLQAVNLGGIKIRPQSSKYCQHYLNKAVIREEFLPSPFEGLSIDKYQPLTEVLDVKLAVPFESYYSLQRSTQ